MIKTQTYTLKSTISLTNEVLKAYINFFWNDIFKPLHQVRDIHLMLICKVEFTDTDIGYRTLASYFFYIFILFLLLSCKLQMFNFYFIFT